MIDAAARRLRAARQCHALASRRPGRGRPHGRAQLALQAENALVCAAGGGQTELAWPGIGIYRGRTMYAPLRRRCWRSRCPSCWPVARSWGATRLRQTCARSCGWSSYLTSLAAGWVLGGHAVTPSMRMALQMRNDPRERAAGSRLASSSYGGSHIIEACLSTMTVLSRLRTSSGVNGHRALAWFLGQICWVG